MQRANVIVRLNGSMTNTVPKANVTPAEILILRALHGGDDAVVDIRPTEYDEKIRPEQEVDRLRRTYERGSSFSNKPGDENKSIVDALFPGAIKRLPLTLEEIGIDSGSIAPASEPLPDLPLAGEGDEPEVEADEAEADENEDQNNGEPNAAAAE